VYCTENKLNWIQDDEEDIEKKIEKNIFVAICLSSTLKGF
jgi:hypothetical protein